MVLSFEKISKLIARSLSITPEALKEAFAPALDADMSAIKAFRQEYLGRHIAWQDETYLRWRYDFSGNRTAALNRLWIIKIDGEILGMIGLDYAEFTCQCERIDAYNPLDLLVCTRLDGLGLGVWMSMVLAQEYELLFAMGATKHSKVIVQKLFTPMPDLGSWKYLLRSSRYLQARIPPFILPMVAAVVDLGLGLKRKWITCGKKHTGQFAPLEHFAAHAPALETLINSYNQTHWIMRKRSADFLDWRFMRNPRRTYQALGLLCSGELSAYAIYHIKDQTVLHIDDLFAASGDLKGLQALLASLLEIACAANVSVVSFTAHNETWQHLLIPFGFTFRDDGHLFGVAVKDHELQAHLLSPPHWWVTSCDTHSEGF
ncbi:MAG: hypothetical protein RL497_1940 [Pseudomonadota bacterium]|jgi:hypothetical protein